MNLLSVNADYIIVLLGEYGAIAILQYDLLCLKNDLKNENMMKNIFLRREILIIS